MLDAALALAARGFYVFPLQAGGKVPPKDMHFKESATRDEAQIRAWWADQPNRNVGIYTGRFADGEALLAIDVDVKKGKRGDHELLRLELEGFDLPDTYTQRTPSGGRHHVYRVPASVRQGADVLGDGLDVRSRGGYVVGAGSRVHEGEYSADFGAVLPAPLWVVERCGSLGAPRVSGDERSQPARDRPRPVPVDPARAIARGTDFLQHTAPLAVEGAAGDETTYRVAARVKDLGVPEDDCTKLMWDHWNGRCSPPWSASDLAIKVHNAYAYGRGVQGEAAPEADFSDYAEAAGRAAGEALNKVIVAAFTGATPPIAESEVKKVHPFDELNKSYAFVIAGGGAHILWETQDAQGRYKLEHLAMGAYHAKHAAEEIQVGKKSSPVTEEWMRWKGRRGYDGLVFMPEQQAPERFYNLWRGFSVAPAATSAHPAVEAWLEHLRLNVCAGNAALANWLIGYFAQMVQRPWEKPLVALVFKGGKGVGKNALVDCVGNLLGHHYFVTSNRRYLVGNFNGHLEHCLLFVLDEAFWSGDKQAEGTLKDLITGNHHAIEHKGKEPYTVDNKTRIAIIGNEDWLVPASHDERRFAVFDVGDGRKQDREFFRNMRAGFEAGGYQSLLRYLLTVSLAETDINEAPSTTGLEEQKLHSLDLVHQWWLECLEEGRIAKSDLAEGVWAGEVSCETFRQAFGRYAQERRAGKWLPDSRSMGRTIKKCVPAIVHKKTRQGYVYVLPMLDACRAAWCKFIGHDVTWQ